MLGSTTAAVAAATAVSAMAWAVRGRSSSVFGPSVWRGQQDRKSIALTFDDGPTPATPSVLKVLADYRIPATFFQIGSSVISQPEIARAVMAAGHELGNHSYTHPNFALTRPSFIAGEFQRTQDAIAEVTGIRPLILRAPYGVRWFGFREMQNLLNLKGVMWSIIGLDWRLQARAIADRILSRVRDGDIICLHDGRGTLKDPDVRPTVEAVRRIVPELLERGYHFETVSQLLCPMK